VFCGFQVGVLVGFEGFSGFVVLCCFLWVFVRYFLCILLVYLKAHYAFFYSVGKTVTRHDPLRPATRQT
jgi:hypothetical protein